MTRTMSKLDLLVIVAAVAGGALLIEQHHRVVIDPPLQAELGTQVAAAACPDNDNVPYSASCISFMEGRFWSVVSGRANAAETPPASTLPSRWYLH
jgi:hypothetical protein